MSRKLILLALGVALFGAACSSAGGSAGSSSPPSSIATTAPSSPAPSGYHPTFVPANFAAVVDNPFFPLKPGTTFIYTGVKDGKPSRDVYTVTGKTKVIDGVPCVFVFDRLYLSGRLFEVTNDYYTQDKQGNVWYFGEDTKELDKNGNVTSTAGTWRAGVDGAQPGIFMDANPQIGSSHRQEYLKGQAEDQYQVVSLSASVKVPYGSFQNALRTKETTALEPGVVDNKYYVKGVGEVIEIAVKGPLEKAVLVAVKKA